MEWVTGEFTKCPSLWYNEYRVVFDAYVYWVDRNTLPHSGGWADQPARLMSLVDIVASEVERQSKLQK